ncbi:MAG: hypothetical protein AAGC70_12590 [Pseudomonadota bacterium]
MFAALEKSWVFGIMASLTAVYDWLKSTVSNSRHQIGDGLALALFNPILLWGMVVSLPVRLCGRYVQDMNLETRKLVAVLGATLLLIVSLAGRAGLVKHSNTIDVEMPAVTRHQIQFAQSR